MFEEWIEEEALQERRGGERKYKVQNTKHEQGEESKP